MQKLPEFGAFDSEFGRSAQLTPAEMQDVAALASPHGSIVS